MDTGPHPLPDGRASQRTRSDRRRVAPRREGSATASDGPTSSRSCVSGAAWLGGRPRGWSSRAAGCPERRPSDESTRRSGSDWEVVLPDRRVISRAAVVTPRTSSGQRLGACCFSRHCDLGDRQVTGAAHDHRPLGMSPREARRRTPPGYGRRPRSAKRQRRDCIWSNKGK